jgi:nucleotide-binding universal stress UspA family protein
MSIVCGIDFSEHSMQAARSAALLAARGKVPLHLVHAIELSSEEVFVEPRAGLTSWAERHLQAAAERLASTGAEIHVQLEYGPVDERLQEVAAKLGASLVVVAALGRRHAGKWQLGSHAERLSQRSHTPVLLVRSSDPFDAWARDERPLRVLLGVDRSLSAEAATRWVGELGKLGRCEVTAVHLYWPPEQFQRLGLAGVRSYVDPDPEVTRTLERNFSTQLGDALGAMPVQMRLLPHLGRVGDRLAALAIEEHADLVVVGSHGRSPRERLLHGSVSHDVVHSAEASVVCIPAPAFSHAVTPAKLTSALVATDFSPTGNAAVPLAYSVVGDGGTVHIVHVVKERGHHPTEPRDIFPSDAADSEEQQKARSQLLELVPHGTAGNRTTLLHVLESSDAARAICQAAERLNAGLICVGTHGRSGLAKVALGSVALSVLSGTQRPVLLARKPVE